jgi:hypothetical protein
MIAALARPPIARLLRAPRALAGIGGWSVLAVAFALAARSRGSAHGADHALVGAYGALVLPLLVYAVVGAVLGGAARSLATSTAPVVAFGASPARAAAVTIGVAAAVSTLAGAALAALVSAIAHGEGDPPVVLDALASAYAGALGGGAYAAWFALGSAVGARGTGRTAMLVADWLLGAGSGVASLATPRGHTRNLLGGVPPMGWSGRASTIALVAIALGCAALAVWRSRRTR